MTELSRPEGLGKRDLLVGLLVATLVDAHVPRALEIAAEACEPLWAEYAPDIRRWYPALDPAHARAAIAYAGRAIRAGKITQDEYDFVCAKARKAILCAGDPPRPFARFPSEPGDFAR